MVGQILRVNDVTELLGVDRSTLWRWEKSGHFPRRRRLGPRTVGWPKAEVDEWVKTRPVVTLGRGQTAEGT